MLLDVCQIPEELRVRNQWVVWRAEPTSTGKVTKRPIDASKPGWHASTTDPKTWSSFVGATDTYKRFVQAPPHEWRGVDFGVGFVFTADDPYVGVDLDKCVGDGHLTTRAQTVLTYLGSYTEYSPSGKGLHIIVKGALPNGGKGIKRDWIEIYDRGRYFTMTGNVLEQRPIVELSEHDMQEFLNLVQQLDPPARPPAPAPAPGAPESNQNPALKSWQDLKLDVNPDAQPPLEKFERLSKNKNFTRTWNRERNGEMEDDSASTYDMALARIAHRHGWTPQEITNLLIYRRTREGLEKTERVDYYQRTLFNMLKQAAYEEALSAIDASSSDDPADRGIIRDTIRTLTGLYIQRYVQYGEHPATYGVWLSPPPDGPTGVKYDPFVHIGSSRAARDQNTWQDIAQERLGVPFPKLAPKRWQSFLRMLGAIREYEEMPENSATYELHEHLNYYGRQRALTGADAETVKEGHAFIEDGHLYFTKREFQTWLQVMHTGVGLTGILGKLRGCGAQREYVAKKDAHGDWVKRRYWRIKIGENDI